MKISIIIQYYNRRQLLLNTLNSIKHTAVNKENIEIIIVDDASDINHKIDNINTLFPELNIITYVFSESEKWWLCPVIPANKGISLATGDVIVFLGAECMFIGDILLDIQTKINTNKYLIYSTLAISKSDAEFLQNSNYIDIIHYPFQGHWYQHSNINNHGYNFCTAICKKDLDELGGFDERFGWGVDYGDVDFISRIKKKNMDIITIDTPYVIHQYHEKFIYIESSERREKFPLGDRLCDVDLYNYIISNEPNNIKVKNSFIIDKN